MDELEHLITEALKGPPGRQLSLSFTDNLLNNVERRLWWREQLQVFGIKAGIVTGTLGIILALMIFFISEASQPFLLFLSTNWQVIFGVGFLVLFTSFSDQVLLKYFNQRVVKKSGDAR